MEGSIKRDSLEHKNGQAHYKENDLDFNELFVEPLKQAIAHDPSVIQGLMQELQKKLSIAAEQRMLEQKKDPAFALQELKTLRFFLYALYFILEDGLKKHKNNEYPVLAKFKNIILNYIEQVDVLSVAWYSTIRPEDSLSMQLKKLFATSEQTTNNKERQELAVIKKTIQNVSPLFERAIKILNDKKTSENVRKKMLEDIMMHYKKGDRERLLNIYTMLQNYPGHLVSKSKRYKEGFPTLFDAQVQEYEKEFKDSVFKPHEAYKSLGLPLWASTKEIENAYEKKRVEPNEASEHEKRQWKAARNASTVLREPLGKQNYDAFLDDYVLLLQLGVDPYFPVKSKAVQEFLKKQGHLARMEINKKVHDEITVLLKEVLSLTMNLGSYFLEFPDFDIAKKFEQTD
ncbi:MAG: hypothetical protein AB7R69_04670 [Candidatus Babeliales bacterium]